MRVRIVGDGPTGSGYNVYLDGEKRDDVVSVDLSMAAGEFNQVTVTFLADHIELDVYAPDRPEDGA